METRQIKIKGHAQIETLKIHILQKLKIIDHKKNNLEEFETRLKDYLQRNSNLKIELVLNNAEFVKYLRFDLTTSNIQTNPYPENYEFGNPLNRWCYEGTQLTQEQLEIKDLKLEQKIDETIERFNLFFGWIETLGNGQIKIERN